MARITETRLPGVGLRYDFTTAQGHRVGVIHHHTGRREMFICSPDDPDRAALDLSLSSDDVRTLVDVLGGSQVIETLDHLQQRIEGLAIDWLAVDPASPCAGRSIGDLLVHTRTGVSVVVILRGDEAHPAPGPDSVIQAGDTLVVVGTAEGIQAAIEMLGTG